MNLAAQLRAPRDTCRIRRLRRLIPLLARASRELPWPSARRCELFNDKLVRQESLIDQLHRAFIVRRTPDRSKMFAANFHELDCVSSHFASWLGQLRAKLKIPVYFRFAAHSPPIEGGKPYLHCSPVCIDHSLLDINSHRNRAGNILPAGALPEFSTAEIVVGHQDNSAHDACLA